MPPLISKSILFPTNLLKKKPPWHHHQKSNYLLNPDETWNFSYLAVNIFFITDELIICQNY